MVNTINTLEFDKIFEYKKNEKWQDNNFKTKRNLPIVLDFSADSWCGPCRMLSPVLDDLSNEYDNKIDFYKIDVDEEYDLSKFFNIRSVPTILFIPLKGQPIAHMGAFPKSEIKKLFVKYFGE